MRILVTGANGQVGRSMLDLDGQDGHEIIGLTRQQFDLTKPGEFDRIVDQVEPDAILNAAAYTAVDKAEDEPDLAHQINAVAPGIMASVAAKNSLPFIHISTDYVFDGKKRTPYNEKDKTSPLNTYGKTKLLGEDLTLEQNPEAKVIRTSWLFSKYQKNFLTIIANALSLGEKLSVVNDQKGCPTSVQELANVCLLLLKTHTDMPIFHFAGPNQLTWFEFACLINQYGKFNRNELIRPCFSEDYGQPAKRPLYTVLDSSSLLEKTQFQRRSLSKEIKHTLNQN